MSTWLGWTLAAAALAAGWVSHGWRGLALALTVIVFWLLLQFSRALRALRDAGRAPVGRVASAVMLNARLHAGMRLPQVLALTGSLGRALPGHAEAFAWCDAAGDEVQVEMAHGRVSAWRLVRAAAPGASAPS